MKTNLPRTLFRTLAGALLALASPFAMAVIGVVQSAPSPMTEETVTLKVLVTAAGVPVVGAMVNFSVMTAGNAKADLLPVSGVATTDGTGTAQINLKANDWPGTYTVTAMSGPDTLNIPITNRPRRSLVFQPNNFPATFVQIDSASATCTIRLGVERLQIQSAPGALEELPFGYNANLGFTTMRLVHCEKPSTTVRLDYGAQLPTNGEVWLFGRTPISSNARWHRASASYVDGSSMYFNVSDMVDGDDDRVNNDEIVVPVVTLLVPNLNNPVPLVQDMWWSGQVENGWGASIIQHGLKLFIVIYAYDDAGKPTWFVMSNGEWNAAGTTYTGPVYTPKGAPFFNYQSNQLVVGAPVGTVTFTFPDAQHATLNYTINGKSGTKQIERQPFGPVAIPGLYGLGDMWWGGLSNTGYGFAILQQYGTLFNVWFTYDANGVATWFVMSGGTWTAADTYEGKIYRTSGSPWVGVPYNPNLLTVTDVGVFKLKFQDDSTATWNFQVEGRTGTYNLMRQPF